MADVEIELQIGRGTSAGEYDVQVLRAAAGGELRSSCSLDVEALQKQSRGLEATVLASASLTRSAPVPELEKPLRQLGSQLFMALFAGDVAIAYGTSLSLASAGGKSLRVVLRLTAPELAAITWEALYDVKLDSYLCRKEPLVRHIDAPFVAEPLPLEPPLRILGIVASPLDLPELNVDAEKRHLEEALRDQVSSGQVVVDWLTQASWSTVHQRLLQGHWHVLHFIGHGAYDLVTGAGRLALVGADGHADWVDATSLADLLGEANPTPRLVVLNSCSGGQSGSSDLFSSTAATLVHRGISSVAAMQFSVTDTAAVAFPRGFYAALAEGRGIDEAMRSGRIEILGTGRGTLEWVTPVLYVRGDSARLFEITEGPPPAGPTPNRGLMARLRRVLHRARLGIVRRPITASTLAVLAVAAVSVGVVIVVSQPDRCRSPYCLIGAVHVGKGPWGLAVDPATHTAYVTSQGEAKVTAIRGSKPSVTRHWDVGRRPSGVAVDSGVRTIYIADFADRNLLPIIVDQPTTLDAIPLDIYPSSVAFVPNPDTIYAVGDPDTGNPEREPGKLDVIRGSELTVSVPVGRRPNTVAVDPSTRVLYVSNYGDGTLSVINGSTYEQADPVRVGQHPEGVAVDPGSHTVYVANFGSNTVTVVDGTTRVTKDIVPVGGAPSDVAVDPATHDVYVANSGDNSVSVIDGSSDKVKFTVQRVGEKPEALAVDPSTHTVYVATIGDDSVSMIQPQQ